MAAPPRAAPHTLHKGLEREDRVVHLFSYARYIWVVLIFLMIVWIITSVRDAGASFDPFHMPFFSVAFPILTILLVVNVIIFIIDYLELKWTTDSRLKVWRAEDFMVNARPVIVIALIMAIFFSNTAVIGIFEDVSTSKGDEKLDSGSDYRIKFHPQDMLDMSFITKLDVKSDTYDVRVFLIQEQDYEFAREHEFNISNQTVISKIHWYSNPGRAFNEDVLAMKLTYQEYAIVIVNLGNDTTVVNYKLYNEISKPLLMYMTIFCATFFGANLAWVIVAYALKRKYAAEFVLKEKQRMMRTYTIEEVFLIYKDGRLIAHNSRRLKPDMDKDILTGMLTAVQSFVKDSFAGEEKGILNELKYGNLKILIENGPRANLAVVIAGNEPASLRNNMKLLLKSVHDRYMGILDDWDGETGRLKDLKKQVGNLVPEEKQRARGVVEEIILMYRDNRFMMHTTQRGQPDVDDNLLYSLLESTKNTAGASLYKVDGEAVYEMPYGNWKVIFEYGLQIYMAVLLSGPEPADLRGRIRSLIAEISNRYEKEFNNWDGNPDKLLEMKPMVESLFIESLKKGKKR
jgi:hypothetical protein